MCLNYFAEYHSNETSYVIVDDSSDDPKAIEDIVEAFRWMVDANVVLRRSEERLGIARAKNACLFPLQEHDHIFLFDDDAWPRVPGWSGLWIDAMTMHDIHHSMYMCPLPRHGDTYSVVDDVGSGMTQVNDWSNCFGVALYFSKHAIEVIGGYDLDKAKALYGYEHAQMSMRAYNAELTGGFQYPSPASVYEWIYTLDFDWHHFQTPPPFGMDLEGFRSSVTPEEAGQHEHNAPMMDVEYTYVPLEDPCE